MRWPGSSASRTTALSRSSRPPRSFRNMWHRSYVVRLSSEFIGLPSAFLQIGAAGVIGTLWSVDDVSTALLMMRFYELHLAGRLEPAAALRSAQFWLRDRTRE